MTKASSLLYFLDKETIYLWGIDKQSNLGFRCLISEESKQVWAWGSQFKKKASLNRLLGSKFPVFGSKVVNLLPDARSAPFTWGMCFLLSEQRRVSFFLALATSQPSSTQNIQYAIVAYFGVVSPKPS